MRATSNDHCSISAEICKLPPPDAHKPRHRTQNGNKTRIISNNAWNKTKTHPKETAGKHKSKSGRIHVVLTCFYSANCVGYFTKLFCRNGCDLQKLRIALDEFSFQSSCTFDSLSESNHHLSRNERCDILLEALGQSRRSTYWTPFSAS